MYRLSKKCANILNSIVKGEIDQSNLPKLPKIPKKDQKKIDELQCQMTGEVIQFGDESKIWMYKEIYKYVWTPAHWWDDNALVALATHPNLSVKHDTLYTILKRKDTTVLKGYIWIMLGYRRYAAPVQDFDAIYIGAGLGENRYVQYVFKNVDGEYRVTDASGRQPDPILILSAIERGINVQWTDQPDIYHLYEMIIKPMNCERRMVRQQDDKYVLSKAKAEANQVFDYFGKGFDRGLQKSLIGGQVASRLRAIADKVETEFYPDKPKPSAVMDMFDVPVYGEASEVERCKFEVAILLNRINEELTVDQNHRILNSCLNRIQDLSDLLLLADTDVDQNRQ